MKSTRRANDSYPQDMCLCLIIRFWLICLWWYLFEQDILEKNLPLNLRNENSGTSGFCPSLRGILLLMWLSKLVGNSAILKSLPLSLVYSFSDVAFRQKKLSSLLFFDLAQREFFIFCSNRINVITTARSCYYYFYFKLSRSLASFVQVSGKYSGGTQSGHYKVWARESRSSIISGNLIELIAPNTKLSCSWWQDSLV